MRTVLVPIYLAYFALWLGISLNAFIKVGKGSPNHLITQGDLTGYGIKSRYVGTYLAEEVKEPRLVGDVKRSGLPHLSTAGGPIYAVAVCADLVLNGALNAGKRGKLCAAAPADDGGTASGVAACNVATATDVAKDVKIVALLCPELKPHQDCTALVRPVDVLSDSDAANSRLQTKCP